MKQKIDYYCRGCASEVRIYGNLGKNATVYCNVCNIEMYEQKTPQNALKRKIKLSQEKDHDKM